MYHKYLSSIQLEVENPSLLAGFEVIYVIETIFSRYRN